MSTLSVFHRGGGKSLGYPPNCLLTINWAVANGAKSIEYDVAVAKFENDYMMIVIEPKLLSEHELNIDNLEWGELSKINAGNAKYGECKVAKLSEVLKMLDSAKIEQQIHIKGSNPKTISTLVRELKNIRNIVLTSFDLEVLLSIKLINPNLKVGWIVKPDNKSGSEGAQDLTELVTSNPSAIQEYTDKELLQIKEKAKSYNIDVIILCAPKVKHKETIGFFKKDGFEVGGWGVGSNTNLAKMMISFKINRFTIDNPEELNT